MIIFVIILALALTAFLVWACADISSGVWLKTRCHVESDDKTVYLTFDDGPVSGTTPKVLDVLKTQNARATFFLIGKNVPDNQDIVRRIIAEGHRIGIHSYSHSGLFPLYYWKKMLKEILDCQKVINECCPEDRVNDGVTLFRPPFGVMNPSVADAVSMSGMTVVGWDVRSLDTMHSEKPEWQDVTLNRIMKRVKPGSVILLHDRMPEADKLLTALLDRLDEEGYRYDRVLPF